jgi:hypothetical protein
MKRARPGQNQKPNLSRRLAMAAQKLISAALHKREAVAAPARLFSTQTCDLMIAARSD